MSCTENESGPFVVFFLPAALGCLLILIARRWAFSQTSNSSTTAFSRRRKIIKDPLIKRPLPTITCKHMPPANSKKANGLAKKNSVPNSEEEMNGNGKKVIRLQRPSPSSTPAAPAETKNNDSPVPPRHIPFPVIPQDSVLLFELILFVYELAATLLQFLNVYRTMWYLPNSYTDQSMHLYLIDPHVVAFIVTILSRRFLLSLIMSLVELFVSPKLWPHAVIAAKMFTLGVVGGLLAWCVYFIAMKHPIMKLFYLCYPVVIYFLLFGLQISPFLEVNNSDVPVMHCCSGDPQHVRAEVDVLRQDFNMRVKKILFNSVIGAYYSSFLPLCFVQPYVVYDAMRTSQQVVFVWGALFCRLGSQLLSGRAADPAHRAALHLGRWRLETGNDSPSRNNKTRPIEPWCSATVYGFGARVELCGERYWCDSPVAAALPYSQHHARFYTVFKNPSTLICAMLCIQMALVIVQLFVLFTTSPWHAYLATFLLIFLNYYSMFKLVRDYLVSWKVYKAESMLQEKSNVAF